MSATMVLNIQFYFYLIKFYMFIYVFVPTEIHKLLIILKKLFY